MALKFGKKNMVVPGGLNRLHATLSFTEKHFFSYLKFTFLFTNEIILNLLKNHKSMSKVVTK